MEDQPNRPRHHDNNFGGLDDPDQLRLVARVCQLSRNCRKQEIGQDEERACKGTEAGFLRGIFQNGVGNQNHHRHAEQIIVKCPYKLGDEQGQEAPFS